MFFFIPKFNDLVKTSDMVVDEESLDETVRYSTYKRRRTILFVVKVSLFLLFLAAISLLNYLKTRDSEDVAVILQRVLNPWVPLYAYIIAAIICAPFKIALTKRRLCAVGVSISRWYLSWLFTIFARFLLYCAIPMGFRALVLLFDHDCNFYWNLYQLYILFVPFLVCYAYWKEKTVLRAPSSKKKVLEEDNRS